MRDLLRLDAPSGLSESFPMEAQGAAFLFDNPTESLQVEQALSGAYGMAAANLAPDREPVRRKADMADWFSAPTWQRTLVSTAAAGGKRLPGSESWLILADAYGLGRARGMRQPRADAGLSYSYI